MNLRPAGFHPEQVVTMRVSLPLAQYRTMAEKEAYLQQLIRRLEAAPQDDAGGFEAGAITMIGPGNPFHDKMGPVKFTSVSAGYLRGLGTRLLKGRWMSNDEPNRVVLVNETFARSLFGGRNPVGQNIQVLREPTLSTIVGVVSDLKRFALDQEAMPEVYVPYKQFPILTNPYIAVRVGADTAAATGSLRKLISGVDRSAPVADVMTLERALSDSIAPRRLNLFLLGSFAAVALLLALTGIYGVISYSVTQRTQEIGVRIALGAQRSEVIRMVVWQGLRVALAGILAGSIMAFGVTRFMASLLYGVKPHDPLVFVGVALALLVTASFACWAPALRAALIDPAIALRYE
jgi:putative ABC transport system permease protein